MISGARDGETTRSNTIRTAPITPIWTVTAIWSLRRLKKTVKECLTPPPVWAGVRIIFDPIAGPLLDRLAEAAAPGATVFQYGWLSGAQTSYPFVPAIQKALTIRGYWLEEITMTTPERLARAKSYVYDLVNTRQLRPKIAKTFRFDDVVKAYRYMESNEQIGKIVLTLGE
jgi:NADPH:quinone reductase-like Zn-dependent oxidoreductase